MEVLNASEAILCNAEVLQFLKEAKQKLPKVGRKHQVKDLKVFRFNKREKFKNLFFSLQEVVPRQPQSFWKHSRT
jgi:hypothetical protein